jgi:hypothetical protein
VKVIDGVSGAVVNGYSPFGKAFRGGVRVAVGDVNGDGVADVITSQGDLGGAVKIMDGASSRALGKFTVGGKGYRDGLYVAAADVDGDGKADIITGRDVGSSSIVEIFNAVGQQPMGSIAPFATGYDEGVRVAAVDVNFDGIADIIAASGTLNGTQVKVYDGRTRAALFSFVAVPDSPDVAVFAAGSASLPSVFRGGSNSPDGR